MFRRILVVVDGGPSDLDVLREAAGLALLSNADLTLLAVVPPYTDIDTGYALPTMVDERLEQTCRTALAVAHSVVPPTIAARCMLRHGDPVGVILAEISGHGHDAVVTGPAGGALIRLSPVLVVVVHDAERAGRDQRELNSKNASRRVAPCTVPGPPFIITATPSASPTSSALAPRSAAERACAAMYWRVGSFSSSRISFPSCRAHRAPASVRIQRFV